MLGFCHFLSKKVAQRTLSKKQSMPIKQNGDKNCFFLLSQNYTATALLFFVLGSLKVWKLSAKESFQEKTIRKLSKERRSIPSPLKSKYQYCLPHTTICFAGLPQHTHTSESFSSTKGIQRDLTPPVSSLSLSSHSESPHHIALIKPG